MVPVTAPKISIIPSGSHHKPHPLQTHLRVPRQDEPTCVLQHQTEMAVQANTTTFKEGTFPKLIQQAADTYQCPLCHKVGPYHALIPHLQGHQKSVVKYREYTVYKCHLHCVPSSHYHCSFCQKVIIRKELFFNHFKSCLMAGTTGAASADPPQKSADSSSTATARPSLATAVTEKMVPAVKAPKILLSKRIKTTCCFCHLVLQKKNLKAHIQRRHSSRTQNITASRYLKCVCVDNKRGIFAVLITFKGPSHYIHVQKCTWGEKPKITCQLDKCNSQYKYAHRSGQVGSYCQHIQSLVYCPVATNLPAALDQETLKDMAVNKWFSKDTERECLRRKLVADADGAPLSFDVNLRQEQRRYFFSVFEPRISSYCMFGRVMVHYHGVKNTWHCPCTKTRKFCPHKAIAKWHLHQLKPEIFTNPERFHEDPSETFAVETDPGVNKRAENISLYPPEGKALTEMVEYLISHKALPANLPKDLRSSSDMPRSLVPCENYCHKCPGKVPLSDPIAISNKAKIVTITEVVEGITTCCKKCATCGTFYRYQEWAEGLHNFNDHIILTHHFCLFLRNSIQNHTAVESVVKALQSTNNQKYPDPDLIRHGYLHFEALSSPVVIMDLHKKGVFSMPMWDLKQPEFDDQVDVEDFWRFVSQEILCRGFVKSLKRYASGKTHKNRHNSEKHHLCDLCGKKFISKLTLKNHRLNHTDEGKRFQSPECPFTAVFKPSLLRHMEQHAKFKSFHCAHCHYSCNIAGALKRHYHLKHPEESYENAGPGLPNPENLKQQDGVKCPECEIVYGTKSELTHHLKTKHNLKVFEGYWEVPEGAEARYVSVEMRDEEHLTKAPLPVLEDNGNVQQIAELNSETHNAVANMVAMVPDTVLQQLQVAQEQEVGDCSDQLMVVNGEEGLEGDQVMVVEDGQGLDALTVLTQGENSHHCIVYIQEQTVKIN